jgi:hypothetical protein
MTPDTMIVATDHARLVLGKDGLRSDSIPDRSVRALRAELVRVADERRAITRAVAGKPSLATFALDTVLPLLADRELRVLVGLMARGARAGLP